MAVVASPQRPFDPALHHFIDAPERTLAPVVRVAGHLPMTAPARS
jgi:hypothetical protein